MSQSPSMSVLIPARNEEWLLNTIQDVLANKRGDTNIIVVLDGAWPITPIPDHPDVHLVYMPEPIGQRAATNVAAKISRAKYLFKLDAHCTVSEGFDVALMTPYETGEIARETTCIPKQINLWVFDRVCQHCGHREYQGPTDVACAKCGVMGGYQKELVWKPRMNRVTTSWVFDENLHFQYDRAGEKKQKGDLCEVMSSLGAFFIMPRDYYWELGGMDEAGGFWGQFAVEYACRTWLSGGTQLTNKRCWASHAFRTQGGNWSFPYVLSGKQVDRARKYSQNMWLNNAWPGQTRPLSFLLDRFWPVQGWSEEARAKVAEAGTAFVMRRSGSSNEFISVAEIVLPLSSPIADHAAPGSSIGLGGEGVPILAVGHPGANSADTISAHDVGGLRCVDQMSGIAAGRVIADDVVKDGNVSPASIVGERVNQPSPHQAVCEDNRPAESEVPVSVMVLSGGPEPAASGAVDVDLVEEPGQRLCVEVGSGCEGPAVSHTPAIVASGTERRLPVSGLVFYTDNRLDPTIAMAVRDQLMRAAGGRPTVSVSLQPFPFGKNIVLPLERSRLSMFKQIMVGLEMLEAEYAFLVEHDVLYHPSHFEFVPPTRDAYYYNEQVYKVDATTGQGVFYYTKQTSGLCADRQLLLEHYRKRVARVERDGYDHAMGYEPGCHKPPRGVDEYPAIRWMSRVPNVDIRHGCNLTKTRWDPAEFRDKSTCQGWTLVDEVPGWGVTKGRFAEFLTSIG